MANKTIPQPKELRLVRSLRTETEMMLATIARHLARQEVRSQSEGKEWDPVSLSNATTAHLVRHRDRLRVEARLVLSGEEI
jgi:hypothetical protein